MYIRIIKRRTLEINLGRINKIRAQWFIIEKEWIRKRIICFKRVGIKIKVGFDRGRRAFKSEKFRFGYKKIKLRKLAAKIKVRRFRIVKKSLRKWELGENGF